MQADAKSGNVLFWGFIWMFCHFDILWSIKADK